MADASVFSSGNVYLVGLLLVVGCVVVPVARAGLPADDPQFPRWVAVWLLISSLICSWDAAFVS